MDSGYDYSKGYNHERNFFKRIIPSFRYMFTGRLNTHPRAICWNNPERTCLVDDESICKMQENLKKQLSSK